MSDSCQHCESHAALEEHLVTVHRHRKVFEAVPARVCPVCGHRSFSWEVAKQMEQIMDSAETASYAQPVPVVPFPSKH